MLEPRRRGLKMVFELEKFEPRIIEQPHSFVGAGNWYQKRAKDKQGNPSNLFRGHGFGSLLERYTPRLNVCKSVRFADLPLQVFTRAPDLE
jgi:hypothetical protein